MEQSDRIHLGSVGWHLTQEACRRRCNGADANRRPSDNRAVRRAAVCRPILLLDWRNSTMLSILSQRHEDRLDLLQVVVCRTNDAVVVRHGARRFEIPYSPTPNGRRVSVHPRVTYSLWPNGMQVSDHLFGDNRS